ncbi:MAG: hypothetical protein QM530_09595 [Phycisphaerales bacterium]|nr:hypothetical protein [Phycisphaerales bacterium]
MKRFLPLIAALAGMSVVAGILLSKMSFLARASMSIFRKKYQSYAFMKVWWQGAFSFFIVLMLLLALQVYIQKKWSQFNSIFAQSVCLFLALVGLYFTYHDFRTDITHRWAGERLHLGFYLFWIAWATISIFMLLSKNTTKTISADKKDASSL